MDNLIIRNAFVFILLLVPVAAIVIYFSKDTKKENYIFNREYTGSKPSSSDYYKLYAMENDTSYPRDRCEFCKKYNSYISEGFQNCSHNCRKHGVSLCDQGKIM